MRTEYDLASSGYTRTMRLRFVRRLAYDSTFATSRETLILQQGWLPTGAPMPPDSDQYPHLEWADVPDSGVFG